MVRAAATKPISLKSNPRLTAGLSRVEAAREHIQRALVEIGYARSDLASVIGFPEDKLRKVIDLLKGEFYGMADRVEKLQHGQRSGHPRSGELDRDPNRDDINPHNNGCGQRSWKASY